MAYEEMSRYLDFRALLEPGTRFTLTRVIATGTYGEIYEATDTENDNRKVAVKIIDNIKENLEEIEEEFRVLAELSLHENFPQFAGIFLKKSSNLEDHQIWFVMELMTHGSVSELARAYKKREERMSESLIAYILKEILTAVQHLHQAHVMHRDVKGMNVLITDEGKIKLVDFGQCGHLDSTMAKRNTAVGTPYWMAPEVIECEQKADQEYDNRCDVWALGITAIELADGDPPYADIHPVRALFQIVRNPPPVLKRSSDWSQDFIDFISECLVKTPDHRPVLIEVMEHPFITSVPEDLTEVRKTLLEERARVLGGGYVPERPLTAIARQGYLKTERRGKPQKMVTDDLASLEFFNDELVVETLYSRWTKGKIYTWVADVLLAVNPFSEKCKYDEEVQVKYKSKSRSQNDPHIFALADRAHQDMMHHKEHQTIVLTGESGSGKTYNFHQLINQLCYIGCSNPGLIDKIKKVCIVLDAFGNAVTQLNPDSTRHTRYFDLTFSKTGKVSGAIVWLLMLDKFRVTERPRSEGNFHMFYYLYDGLSQSSRLARYGLKLGRKYYYLGKHPYDNEVTNAQRFTKVEEALQPVKEVCRLLDVEEKKLCWALCNFCRVKDDQTVESAKRSQDEAELSKDALARTLYSRIMDFIVNLINTKLSVTRLVFGDPFAIGILDMFGFEANDHNTLENLLVNVANEQNFTFPDNRHILELFLAKSSGFFSILEDESRESIGSDTSLSYKLKQGVNQKQMIQVSEFTYAISHYVGRVKYDLHGFVYKNRDHISAELVQTMRKSANDHIRGMFCNKLTKTGNVTAETEEHQQKKMKDKGGAGKTGRKDSRRFNTKSKGRMSQTRHVQTLGMNFRYSLIELLYKLTNSQPHFLRCIRSNMDNSSSVFDRDMIKHQVKYHAICDTIRIRQQGFSHRIPYQEFLRRYQFLAFDFDEIVEVTKDNARLLLLRLKMEGWAIGKDKVFIKYYNEEFLSRLYESSVKKIVKIQAMMRAYMQRKKKKAGQLKPTENFRGYKVRQENPEIANKIRERQKFGEKTLEAEAARYVQHYFRRWKMRTLFQQLQIYRADKTQHLVYFSQQVHLYGQEMQARLQRLNHRLDLGKVRNEAPGAHKTILVREKIAQPKLALDHMLNAYFDTTFLCDPSRAKKGRQQDDDWEAPFKSRASAARSENMGLEEKLGNSGPGNKEIADTPMDVRSKTALFDQGQNANTCSGVGGGSSSYNRFAGSSSNRPASSYNKFAGSSYVPPAPSYNSGSYIKSQAPKPSVAVNSWNERQHNGYSDNMDPEDQGTHDFRKHLRKTNRSAILEMEARAAASSGGDEGNLNFQFKVQRGAGGDRGHTPDSSVPTALKGEERGGAGDGRDDQPAPSEPEISAVEELRECLKGMGTVPYEDNTENIQGILRKTSHSRDSMKRNQDGASSYANGDHDMPTSPTFYEETEEAML
ncbi:Neither inactivation nor afterpotential protein C-like [Homarus americanus]|uniref:Neither inactivation nor afterpotential protein C-like n=1 Tax=Homarus americanus TaxID=6706 RepID=A0A8J5K9P8_HOMAM|nr:Neither inactivation nor afterpotential protein C-like [Homarus americanus]